MRIKDLTEEDIKSLESQLIGLKIDQAITVCDKLGLRTRILQRDDEHYAVTCDYVATRVNLRVVVNKVTSMYMG